jgi:hypothetical protein
VEKKNAFFRKNILFPSCTNVIFQQSYLFKVFFKNTKIQRKELHNFETYDKFAKLTE